MNEIKTVNIATYPRNLHLKGFYNHPTEFMVIWKWISIIRVFPYFYLFEMIFPVTYPSEALEVEFSKILVS